VSALDYFLHRLSPSLLQRAHSASRQEPHAFIFVAAVDDVYAVTRYRVMKRRARIFGDEIEEGLPPWIVGVVKNLIADFL